MFSSMYAFRYYGLFEEILKIQDLFYSDTKVFVEKYSEIMKTENAQYFAMVVMVIKSVIFPQTSQMTLRCS